MDDNQSPKEIKSEIENAQWVSTAITWTPKEREHIDCPFTTGQLLRSKENYQYKLEGSEGRFNVDDENQVSLGENTLPAGSIVMFLDYTKRRTEVCSYTATPRGVTASSGSLPENEKQVSIQSKTSDSEHFPEPDIKNDDVYNVYQYKLRLLFGEQVICLFGIKPENITKSFEPCEEGE